MERRIEIATFISSDVRSRTNAEKILSVIDSSTNAVVLDFKNVVFVSRSFADELCDIIERLNNVAFSEVNMSDFVSTMLMTVSKNRNKKRSRTAYESEIVDLEDMESLTEYFTHADMYN